LTSKVRGKLAADEWDIFTSPDVERVRTTAVGKPDKWRKP